MKMFFRCCTTVLGLGTGTLLLVGFVLFIVGNKDLALTYSHIPLETVNIPTDPNAIVRGEHIATIWGCKKCHGEELDGTLIDDNAFLGTIPAPNLTSGHGGVANSYTDEDWVHAIRHGVKQNGKAEMLMYNYSPMSDQDLGDLIAYLKQLPPVDSTLPPLHSGFMLPIGSALGILTPAAEKIDQHAPRLADPIPGTTIEYGKYLSAICTECHREGNIGKALDTWSQTEFIHAFQTGMLTDGKQISRAMRKKTFSALNDTELTALWLYFRSLRPPESQE